jgi:hypothetical protein
MPEPRRGSAWGTRLISHEIIVAEADGRLLGSMSRAEGGYIRLHHRSQVALGNQTRGSGARWTSRYGELREKRINAPRCGS